MKEEKRFQQIKTSLEKSISTDKGYLMRRLQEEGKYTREDVERANRLNENQVRLHYLALGYRLRMEEERCQKE